MFHLKGLFKLIIIWVISLNLHSFGCLITNLMIKDSFKWLKLSQAYGHKDNLQWILLSYLKISFSCNLRVDNAHFGIIGENITQGWTDFRIFLLRFLAIFFLSSLLNKLPCLYERTAKSLLVITSRFLVDIIY